MEWSNEDMLRLIDEYRIRPVLWDPTSELFKNRNKKEDAWMFKTDTVEIKRKINSLTLNYYYIVPFLFVFNSTFLHTWIIREYEQILRARLNILKSSFLIYFTNENYWGGNGKSPCCLLVCYLALSCEKPKNRCVVYYKKNRFVVELKLLCMNFTPIKKKFKETRRGASP
ncbi:hypothetical protein RI129_004858 [Pyrocoelia pectoralis]|uniref:MADF domain-containing protein n=1 Tax=Pyrocoelia pectoralis TaxID=417401 RepID=A0AAN7VLP3_9COLE